jgi:hypothetical protein
MKRALIVAVILGVVGVGLAWGEPAPAPQAQQVMHPTQIPSVYTLKCQPFGSTEFVNDLQIWNQGTKAVPSGTKVHWEVMNGQWKGDYTFTADLAPGAKVILDDVMNGAQSQGNCTVKTVLKSVKKVVDPEIIKKLAAVLQCQPYGATEFVNDVMIWNKGNKALAPGTKVHWEVMNGQWKGDYTFAAGLAPGAHVILDDVMNGAQSQGNCTVKVVQ